MAVRVFMLLLSHAIVVFDVAVLLVLVVLDVLLVLEFVVLLVFELVEFVFEFVVFDVEVPNLLKASVREAISFCVMVIFFVLVSVSF